MLISKELEKTLKRATEDAKRRQHEFVSLEHLLHALTFDAEAANILHHCGVNLLRLRENLHHFLIKNIPMIRKDSDFEPQYTLGVQFVLQLAAAHVQSAGRNQMDGGSVLAALFREKESHAVYFLRQEKVSRFDVVRFISHATPKEEASDGPINPADPENTTAKSPLAKLCVNLNEKALQGRIDPLVGREKEIERIIHILSRRRKNNPVLVGDAGVGKTAIIEGLASRIVQKKVPAILQDATVYSLELGNLMAGTKFRGEFEEKLKSVIDALKAIKNSILFIDEIHTLIGAGAVNGSTLDASNILKPALSGGEIKCIGTTTYEEYRKIFEKEHAFSRRFQKIDVGEPSPEDCLTILFGLKKHYEEFHKVRFDDAALKAAVDLSHRYMSDRFLPDKAIDLMDEAAAKIKLNRDGEDYPSVTEKDIEEVIARLAGIPQKTLQTDDKNKLENLDRDLKLLIYGQDEAINKVVRSIRLSRAGLGDPEKPIGSFLFSGPTGVGKTELAKQLTKTMGIEFIRFDMSEYMEKHTVSRLIGSPPGYVGFEQGGLLTDAIHRHPHAVLLLDEIEKAHPDLFNILLQVMDHASLTDNNGRKSDFKHVILIMTTNTGARESSVKPIGFGKADYEDKSQKAIEQTFSPEFRNRLTAIIPFNPLEQRIAEQIVDKLLAEFEARLKLKNVSITLEPDARTYLAQKGFDAHFGARPIRRLIENEVAHPLSEQILFGKLMNGGQVIIRSKEDGLSFEYLETHKELVKADAASGESSKM